MLGWRVVCFLSQISYLPVAVSGNVFLAAYSDKIVEGRFFPFYNLLHERLSRDVVYLVRSEQLLV